MKLNILTLVLDGEPFIRHHLAQFEKSKADWHWYIVEGVAAPVKCTSWCKSIAPRLSLDGTTQYLETLKKHPRVTVLQKPLWQGKIEMLNTAVKLMTKAGALLQVDCDELWTFEQIDKISGLFEKFPQLGKMYFFCNYFVGPRIVTKGNACYGNQQTEWLRAWRFEPGMEFQKHEPPVFNNNLGSPMGKHETKAQGLVFDHMAYVLESQVRFKEAYYGYAGAVNQWRELQNNHEWPLQRLKNFLPWVDEKVGAAPGRPPIQIVEPVDVVVRAEDVL